MSFKEIKEALAIFKELECPETVEIDSFQYPDFPLVARILHWLVTRCDPTFQIPLEIEAEQDRVFFLKAITDHMSLKYNLILDPRKLYLADGYAVRELLKIGRLLSNSHNVWTSVDTSRNVSIIDEDVKAKVLAKVVDLQTFRKDQGKLAVSSAEMSETLRSEPENHIIRIDALNTKLDPGKIESSLSESILEIEALANEYDEKFANIEFDKANLEAKIKKREEELERMQRRLLTIQKTKPTHFDESDKLESEMKDLYNRYSLTFRTFVGLEHQVNRIQSIINEQKMASHGKRSGIDDGFSEDPVEGSDDNFDRTRGRQSISRGNAIDEISISNNNGNGNAESDDEIPPASAGNNRRVAGEGSSDDDF